MKLLREVTDLQKFIRKLASGNDLTKKEAFMCMEAMISGEATPIQMASILSLLTLKGEKEDEITGFAKSMRRACKSVNFSHLKVVDTCGTGGDKFKTFNVSTAAAIIAAAAGVPVAKHGNRAVTSSCGGADILEAAGIKIELSSKEVLESMEKLGIGFMFAPNFHPATWNVMPVRNELGIRTVFNLLGPLTSPAKAPIQLIGVFDPYYVDLIARVLNNMGIEKAMVVHGYDSHGNPAMDEISNIGPTLVALVENGEISIQKLNPEDFGVEKSPPELIKSPETIEDNLNIFLSVLAGEEDSLKKKARLELVLANAGAIIFLAGKSNSLEEGTKIARKTVISKKAMKKLEEFRQIFAK